MAPRICAEIYTFRHKPQRPTRSILIRADGVVVKPLSDASLCFNTCVILRADNTSRLIEEYVRMFLRRYSSQRLPPRQVELSPSARVLDWKTSTPPSRP
jgi:hypothetical protein